MSDDDKVLEAFLKEFAPCKPRALPLTAEERWMWSRRMAAASILAVGIGGAVWLTEHSGRPVKQADWVQQRMRAAPEAVRKPIPTIQLTKLAIENPEKLDAMLTEEWRKKSAGLRGKESMLRVLEKE